VPRFAHMTFPAYRRLLGPPGAAEVPVEPGEPSARPLAVRALVDAEPAGLALAAFRPSAPGGPAELLSILVADEWRGRGIATRLLERIEDMARERGAPILEAVYMTGKPSTEALERLLAGRGWSTPERRAVTVRFTPEEATRTPWWERGRLAPGDDVLPWREVTPGEIDALRASQAETGWIPSGLEPWWYDATGYHEPSSLGLRRRAGSSAGPSTTRSPPTPCGSPAPTSSRRSRPRAELRALRASIRRLADAGVAWCTFMTYVEQPRMVRFVERRCAAWASFFAEMRGTSKVLGAGGGSVAGASPGSEDQGVPSAACGASR